MPKCSEVPGKSEIIRRVADWLIAKDIISKQQTDCVLGFPKGYPISQGAVVTTRFNEHLPFRDRVNGMQIVTERRVFHSNDIDEFICPNCKNNLSKTVWNYFNDWFEGKFNELKCPNCNSASEINTYQISPQWAFSDLGFEFYNWQLFSEEFIDEFRKVIGCEIAVVYYHG